MTRSPRRSSLRFAAIALATLASLTSSLVVVAQPAAPKAPTAPTATPATPVTPPVAAPTTTPAQVAAARPPVVAILLDAKDLRRSTLVGPSGQIYEPRDAAPSPASPPAAAAPASSPATAAPAAAAPRWVRRGAGGVSATVAGAARLDGELLVSGSQTPVFRHRQGQWLLAQLGQRGRVHFGAGPHFSVAIGRQIFLHVQGRFTRVATAPGPVVALWAASENDVAFATDQVVMRRRNKAFVLAAKLPGVLSFSGAVPHAITTELAVNVRTGAKLRLPGPVLRVVRSESTPAAILRLPAGALVLARDLTTAATTAGAAGTIELPRSEEPSLAAIDAAGRALIVAAPTAAPSTTAAPTPATAPIASHPPSLLVYDGTTWAPAALVDELPAPRTGPAAARSR